MPFFGLKAWGLARSMTSSTGKRECEMCKKKAQGHLNDRDWTAVKYFVKNLIDKRKIGGSQAK